MRTCRGRTWGRSADAIDRVIGQNKPEAKSGIHVEVSGQVRTMRESFNGLYSGIGLAVILVFLLMVINFQSWLDR